MIVLLQVWFKIRDAFDLSSSLSPSWPTCMFCSKRSVGHWYQAKLKARIYFFYPSFIVSFFLKKKNLVELTLPVHIHFMHSVFPFFIQQLNSVTSSSFMWQTKGLQKVVHFEGRYFSLSWEWRSCKLDWKSIRIRLTSFSTAFFLQGWSHTWREQETRSSHE